MQNIKSSVAMRLSALKSVSNLVIILKASVITAAVLAIFYQDLSIIFADALQDEATSHVLAIPFLFAYLLYRKRKMVRAVIPFEPAQQSKWTKRLTMVCGILCVATAAILYWYGSYTFTPLEYHILTLPILTAGLVLLLFNLQTLRQLAFPIVFLTFLSPPPLEILYGLGSTLSVISSEASNAIVHVFGIQSVLESQQGNPTIIITRPDQSTARFTVDLACSGIYSLIGFLIFAAFIAYLTRDKTWKKAIIFILGFPMIYLFNIIRITIILLIGYQYGQELALQVFHLLGGWLLIFLGTLLLLTISEKIFKTQIFTKPLPSQCPKCNQSSSKLTNSYCASCGRLLSYKQIKLHKSDMVKIAAVAIAMVLLLSIQAPVLALTREPYQVLIQTPLGEEGNPLILKDIPGYTLLFNSHDKTFEQKAKQDYALLYTYNKTGEPTVWVGIEIASARTSLHRWETCLVTWPETHGYQPKVAQLDLRDIQILDNPPIIARYFAFQYTLFNETQVVLYWFETSIFTINGTSQQKQVEISLIGYPDDQHDVRAIEDHLYTFAVAIAGYWQPIKTWNQIAIVMSKNGKTLAAATTIPLVAIVAWQMLEKRRTKKRNTNTLQKLPTSDQRIISALQKAEKITAPTTSSIANAYQITIHKEISQETINQTLEQIQKTGLVTIQITNRQDQPVQTWKTILSEPSKTPRPQRLIDLIRKH